MNTPIPPYQETPSSITQKLNAIERLMRLDKPIGIFLLLWPTLIALWMASYGVPDILTLFFFVMGTVLMRSAGCVINDLWDRDVDGHVWRTANRPLVTGVVSKNEAIAVVFVLLSVALGILMAFNHLWMYMLAVLGVIVTIAYPLFKRFFSAPQAVLGIAFSLGIPMAFASQWDTATVLSELKPLPLLAWGLFGLNFFYTIAYDTVYAMADRHDDVKVGIKSTAILLGRFDVLGVMACYLIYFIGMVAIDVLIFRWSWWSVAAESIALCCIVYQWVLIRQRHPQSCFQAFRQSHWIAFSLLCGQVLPQINVFAKNAVAFFK